MAYLYDSWLDSDGPVALVIRDTLEPVTGPGTAFFPPTFAPAEGAPKGTKPQYVIDENGVCLIDSVGSQGNRLEPMFKRPPLAELVPQVTITIGERELNLLDVGHRAADAVMRFSSLGNDFHTAFVDYKDRGDAAGLAKIAPTSLVFGAWDSRVTGAKVPRLVESTVRAFAVERLTRSAQYFAALNDGERSKYGATSEEGLLDAPSGRTPGGVIARDGIRRDAVLNLVALRSLKSSKDDTRKLQRYILGLSLTVLLAPAELYLRQGCLLVAVREQLSEKSAVMRDGARQPIGVTYLEALAFATTAAGDFIVGADRRGQFDGTKVPKKGQ